MVIEYVKLLCIFLLIWLCHRSLRNYRYYTQILKIPCYATIPIIGELFTMARYRLNVIKMYNLLCKTHGGIFRLHGRRLTVVLQKPEYIETLFTHPDLQDKGTAYDGLAELLGNSSLFVLDYVIKMYNLLCKTHGGIFRLHGRRLTVVLQKPEYIETLFTHPDLQDKGTAYDGLAELLGNSSLFVLDSENSRAAKKAFVKNFNNCSQKLVVDNFYKTAEELNVQLKALSGGPWFQVGTLMKNIISTSFLRTILDIELKDYKYLEKGVADFERYAFHVVARGVSPLHQNDFIFKYFLGGKELYKFIEDFDSSIQQIILKKREELAKLILKKEIVPNQFIYNVLQDRASDPDALVGTDIKTLIAAALDTTYLATSFTLLMLGMHADAQDKVHEEDKRVQEMLQGRDMVESDFNKYEYLTRVIKETMRLYPPVPLAPREARADVKIGKFTIPAGSSVVGSSLTIHRDPDTYENPLYFDPDRFLSESTKLRHKFSYCPFSAGQRNCPGYRYGIQSVIFFASWIVRNFKIYSKYQSINEIDKNLDYILSLYDKDGFLIRVERR